MPIPSGYESIDLVISENETDIDSSGNNHRFKIKTTTKGKQIRIHCKVKKGENILRCKGHDDNNEKPEIPVQSSGLPIPLWDTPLETDMVSFSNGEVTFNGNGFVMTGVVTKKSSGKKYSMMAQISFTELPPV